MAMGNNERSRDKMSGPGTVPDFHANCRATEKTQKEHVTKMDHTYDPPSRGYKIGPSFGRK